MFHLIDLPSEGVAETGFDREYLVACRFMLVYCNYNENDLYVKALHYEHREVDCR